MVDPVSKIRIKVYLLVQHWQCHISKQQRQQKQKQKSATTSGNSEGEWEFLVVQWCAYVGYPAFL